MIQKHLNYLGYLFYLSHTIGLKNMYEKPEHLTGEFINSIKEIRDNRLKRKNNDTKDMTQEEKDLVLIDLCGRLPYGVKIKEEYGDYINVNIYNAHIEHLIDRVVSGLDMLVLRPLSSMTEEEYQEFNNIRTEHTLKCLELDGKESFELGMRFQQEELNYLYQKHYDIYGLISKGLALEAPEGIKN